MNTDNQTVRTSVTIYPDQKNFLEDYAKRYHRGKLSRAIQALIEQEMQNEGTMIMADPKPSYSSRPLKKTKEESA